MAVVKTMNATIITGEYTNAQGEQKKSYMTIGTLFIYDDGGMSLKLDAAPIGGGNINFYDKKSKDENNNAQQGEGNQQGYQQQQYAPQQQQYQAPQPQYTDANGNPTPPPQYNR